MLSRNHASHLLNSFWALWLTCAFVGCLAGCGGTDPVPAPANGQPAETQTPANSAPAEAGALRIVAAETLPIGDYLPPLDEGRVELAVPEGWSVPSRDRRYVVKMLESSTSYPRLLVTSTPDDWSGISELTDGNVGEFAAAVAERLESAEKKIEVIEPVIPMVLGDRPVARYVRRTRFKDDNKSIVVERQILVTLGAGQIYEVDLQSPVGRLTAYRDAAYAVAASMKFANDTPPDTTPPDTAPADTAPADTAPADTAPADTAPPDTAPPDTAPADTAPADTAPADTAPADTAPADEPKP